MARCSDSPPGSSRPAPESEVHECTVSRAIPVLLLFASLLLPSSALPAPIGWSTPRQLAPDTAAFVRQAWHSTDARDTALWTMWFEDRGRGPYSLKASRFSNGTWSVPESVASDTIGGNFVEATVDAGLKPWAVWSYSRFVNPDSIYSFCLWSNRQSDSWTTPQLISQDTVGSGGNPAVCSDPEQGIWAIWPKRDIEADSVSILSSYCRTDSWSPQVVVARFDWWIVPYVPVLTAPPGGKVRSVWTGALSGGIGIYSANWSGDSWENHELIPGSSIGYWPSVCSDSVGGTWVTWYDGFSGDSALIRYAHHDGAGWTDAGPLATGDVYVHRGMLCCDEQGWIWALWVQPRGASDTADISVRYFDGDSWSDRRVVTACSDMYGYPRITAALGRVWVTWTQEDSAGRELLYYSHTLPAGITEQRQQRLAGVRISPSVVRAGTATRLSGLQPEQTVELLDASGRKVEAASQPRHRDLCTSLLPPGVYFVRITGGGQPVSRKFLVVR
jgi:hypothetical protein